MPTQKRKYKKLQWERERPSLFEEDEEERKILLAKEKAERAAAEKKRVSKFAKKRGVVRGPKEFTHTRTAATIPKSARSKAHGGMAKKSGTHLNFNSGGLAAFHKLSK